MGKWNLHYRKKLGDPVLVRMRQFKKEVKMTGLEKPNLVSFSCTHDQTEHDFLNDNLYSLLSS